MSKRSFFEWVESCPRDGEVHLVVPSNIWGRELRRRLDKHGVRTFGVRTYTVNALAERVATPRLIQSGKQALTETAQLVLIREAAYGSLDGDPFGADVRKTPGFTSILTKSVRALRSQGVSPQDIRDVRPRAPLYRQARMSALAALYERYLDALRVNQLFDIGELLETAISTLRDGRWFETESRVAMVGHHEPDGLAERFVDLLSERSEHLTGAPLARFVDPFPPPTERHHALDHLRRHLFEPTGQSGTFDDSLRVLPCAGARGEFDASIRFIAERASKGTRWNDQAILVPSDTPYGQFFHGLNESGLAIDIPVDNHVGFSLADTRPGRGALGLLTLSDELRVADLFDHLATGELSVADHQVFQAHLPEPADRLISPGKLQKLVRDARVVSGDDWSVRLLAEAEKKAESAADGTARFPEQLRREARQIRALSAVAMDLRRRLSALGEVTSLTHACALFAELVGQWMRRPEDALVRAFAEELRRVPETRSPVTWSDAHQFIAQALRSRRAPKNNQPGGVLVADIESAAGLSFDSAVIMGLAERAYPPPPRRDALLPDDVCELLGFPTQAQVAEKRRALFKRACSAVRQSLRISYPAVEGNDGVPRVPSSFALAVELATLGTIQEADSRQAVPRLPRSITESISESEHWLRRILDDRKRGIRDLMELRTELQPALKRNYAIFGERLSEWEGIVPPSMAQEALARRGGAPSITGFERYAKCPSGFFFGDLLRIKELDDPAEATAPDALDIGSALHRALEDFMAPYIGASAPGLPPDDPATQDALASHVRAQFQRLQMEKNYVHPGETQRVTDEWVGRMKTWLSALDRSGDWTPYALELAFGSKRVESQYDAYRLAWDGGECEFRGEIDRVDRREVDGDIEYRIVDYKSGRWLPKSSAKQSREAMESDFVSGSLLQFGAYALAVEQVLGHPVTVTGYDYLSPNKGKPVAVTIPWNPEQAEKMRTVLQHLLASMRAGLFARGLKCNCRPKGICGGTIQLGRAPNDPLWNDYRLATGTPERAETTE